MPEIVDKEETSAVIGGCFEVVNGMGCGFLESVDQECLDIQLGLREIPFQPRAELQLCCKGAS
jgi:GxxExxY protein